LFRRSYFWLAERDLSFFPEAPRRPEDVALVAEDAFVPFVIPAGFELPPLFFEGFGGSFVPFF
jgi:hypothetical protein